MKSPLLRWAAYQLLTEGWSVSMLRPHFGEAQIAWAVVRLVTPAAVYDATPRFSDWMI